jgi:hypothetical protein
MVELLEFYRGIMDWIDLPEDRGGLQAIVSAAMNLQFP